MTEEQKKLKNLVDRLEGTKLAIQKLRADEKALVDFTLRLEGAIEAFGILGIELPGDTDDSRS